MKPTDLKTRIIKAKEAIDNYPKWVKSTMVFQGGGLKRGDNLDTLSHGNSETKV